MVRFCRDGPRVWRRAGMRCAVLDNDMHENKDLQRWERN